MKKYLLAFALMAFGISAINAQTEATTTETQATDSNYTECEQVITPIVANPTHTQPYYQTVRPFYSDVYTTANMHPAVVVNAVNGGVSINGGRTDGTAFFFNGVRVMDNIPTLRPLNPVDDTKPTP